MIFNSRSRDPKSPSRSPLLAINRSVVKTKIWVKDIHLLFLILRQVDTSSYPILVSSKNITWTISVFYIECIGVGGHRRKELSTENEKDMHSAHTCTPVSTKLYSIAHLQLHTFAHQWAQNCIALHICPCAHICTPVSTELHIMCMCTCAIMHICTPVNVNGNTYMYTVQHCAALFLSPFVPHLLFSHRIYCLSVFPSSIYHLID